MKPQPEKQIQSGLSEFWEGTKTFFAKLIDLRKEVDPEGTIINIRNNKKMMGSNAWMLMCSIVIASIGLDQNSQAVIIGAMLISPLMSPILGVGMAVGINDRIMLQISLRHFGIAIGIALTTSLLYFWLTPFGGLTEQIEARTSPTFLDVLIAFFGGIAGIVSGSRKDLSNAIPGVAIATALMPPLCVTGYGIANGDWIVALNSFYLFFLNSVFVALATYIIVRWLKFPMHQFADAVEQRKARNIIAVIAILLIIPSFLILRNVLSDVQARNSINAFVTENFEDALPRITKINGTDSLAVRVFLFEEISDDSIKMYEDRFAALDGCEAKFKIIQQPNFEKAQFEQLESAKTNEQELVSIIDANRQTINDQTSEINRLKGQMDSLRSDPVLFKQLTDEIKILYPTIEGVSFSRAQTTDFDTLIQAMPTLFVQWNSRVGSKTKRREQAKLQAFVTERIDLDTLRVVSE